MLQRGVANARSRMPLVPKELIVPTCQRLAFVLFVMCGTAMCIRLAAYFQKGKIVHGRLSAAVNETHFFLDIGNEGIGAISHTAHLEENGWRGICASPYPDAQRSCKAISMPVVAVDGEQVMVEDCASPMQVLLKSVRGCPSIERAGVGIVDLLTISKAPAVIDYVSLDTQGTELAILKRFPFDKFCVRAWTVANGNDVNITSLLVAQGCDTKLTGAIMWARCGCNEFSQNLLQLEASLKLKADDSATRNLAHARRHTGPNGKSKFYKRTFSNLAVITGHDASFVSQGTLPEETHHHHTERGPDSPTLVRKTRQP